MSRFHQALRGFAVISFALFTTSITHAAVTRTWVSGLGNDNNPCSYTAPCATFTGAYAKTAINGEINCLDPGDYGPVTINHSITIDCRNSQGSILANNGALAVQIVLNEPVADDPLATVRLRGLSINGTGPCGPGCGGFFSGYVGVNVASGVRRPKVFLEDLIIENFVVHGILFVGNGGELSVKNCALHDNAKGITVASLLAGQNGIIRATIDKTHADLNDQGVRFEGNAIGVIKDSSASNNGINGFVVLPSDYGNSEMTIRDSTANNNRQYGVFSGGSNGFLGTVRIVNTTAIHNTISQLEIGAGGTLCTNQKNHIGVPSDVPSPCFLDQ